MADIINESFSQRQMEKLIKEQRDNYLKKAILGLTIKRPSSLHDSPDSKYQFLLKESDDIPDFINRNKCLFMKPTLSLEVLYLLGEIHSFESFGILLENYIIEPNFRSAITLTCCTDISKVEILFNKLNSHGLLDTFLKVVFTNIPGNYWSKISSLSFEQKVLFYKTNFDTILIQARERAKPIQG